MKMIFVSGRLTTDPEVKDLTEKKAKVANFRIANNDGGKDNADYYDVACWDKQAEFAENYLKKGQKIMVYGSCQNESYKDKDGTTRYHFRITAHNIEFAG